MIRECQRQHRPRPELGVGAEEVSVAGWLLFTGFAVDFFRGFFCMTTANISNDMNMSNRCERKSTSRRLRGLQRGNRRAILGPAHRRWQQSVPSQNELLMIAANKKDAYHPAYAVAQHLSECF
jgi:hypothetical protein